MAPLLPGCATANGGSGRLARIAGASANIAATTDLIRNPQHRANYEATVAALNILLGDTNTTPAQLAMALGRLPMLRGPEGAVYVSALTPLIWDEATQSATRIERMAGLQYLIRQVRDGLAAALASRP